jgi:putative hydrolase of the HAD superfamily
VSLEVVFLDVGGPIYDDVWYGRALLTALRDLGAEVEEDEFWLEVERCRSAQAGMTGPLTRRFLGPDADPKALAAAAKRHWRYPREALYGDVLPTLKRLAGSHRLGVLANQPDTTRAALERDGVAQFIDLWVVSDEVGLAKPDPTIFAHAVREAGCRPDQAAFVGNRLDNDIRPAHATGLRTVWILRGEAPPHPTHEQLAEPDAVISALAELPAALERLGVAA